MKSNKQLQRITNYLIMLFTLAMSIIAIGNAFGFLLFPPSRHGEIMGLNVTRMIWEGIGGELLLSCITSAILILCSVKKWVNLDMHKKIVKITVSLCASSEALIFLSFLASIYNYSKDHLVFLLMLVVYIAPILCEYFFVINRGGRATS